MKTSLPIRRLARLYLYGGLVLAVIFSVVTMIADPSHVDYAVIDKWAILGMSASLIPVALGFELSVSQRAWISDWPSLTSFQPPLLRFALEALVRSIFLAVLIATITALIVTWAYGDEVVRRFFTENASLCVTINFFTSFWLTLLSKLMYRQ